MRAEHDFDRLNDVWAATYRGAAGLPLVRSFVDRACDLLGPPGGLQVLDAGCGTGQKTLMFAERGYSMTGVDLSPAACAQAQAEADRRGLPARCGPADLLELPFPSAHFDHVCCWSVLMHVPAWERALGELTRVLKPGGLLLLKERNLRSPEARLDTFLRRFSPRHARRLRRLPGALETHWNSGGREHVTRQWEIPWLTAWCQRQLPLEPVTVYGAELTELYTRPGLGALRQLNRFWFRLQGPASLSVANFVVLRRLP